MNLAVRLHRIAHALVGRWTTRWLGKLVYWFNRLVTSSDIDPRCVLASGVQIPHGTGVVIGEMARVGEDTVIMPGVVIGAIDWSSKVRHPQIGCRVLIGAGAKVLGPLTVGDDVRIGANAVVLSDIPARATVVGIPAATVRER